MARVQRLPGSRGRHGLLAHRAAQPPDRGRRENERTVLDDRSQRHLHRARRRVCALTYLEQGEIANCGGAGRCAYTTRRELAYAYARLLTQRVYEGKTLAFGGEPITQVQLAGYLGDALEAEISYRSMSDEEYLKDRVDALGVFLGTVVAGIYQGIRRGVCDTTGDFMVKAVRPMRRWPSPNVVRLPSPKVAGWW